MLFQGQEFAASAPFLYFADFEPELAAAVRKGRGEFLAQFPSIVDVAATQRARRSRRSSTRSSGASSISPSARRTREAYALHVDLLRIRREDAGVPRQQPGGVDGAVLSAVGLRAAVLHARPSRTIACSS